MAEIDIILKTDVALQKLDELQQRADGVRVEITADPGAVDSLTESLERAQAAVDAIAQTPVEPPAFEAAQRGALEYGETLDTAAAAAIQVAEATESAAQASQSAADAFGTTKDRTDQLGDSLESTGRKAEDAASSLGKVGSGENVSGMDKASEAVESLSNASQGGISSLAGLGRGAAGAASVIGGALVVGIGAAASAVNLLREPVHDALSALDSLEEAALRTGVAVEALQELRFAFSQVGVSASETDSALAMLTRNIGRGASGTKAQAEAFAALGVSLVDANGNIRSTDAVLSDVADGLANTTSAAERMDLATRTLGRGNTALIAALAGGSRALDDMREKARDLGLVIEGDVIAESAKLADEWDALAQVVDVQLTQALITLGPIFVDIAKLAAEAAVSVGDFIQSFKDTDERSTASLERRRDLLRTFVDKPRVSSSVRDELNEIEQELRLRRPAPAAGRNQSGAGEGPLPSSREGDSAREDLKQSLSDDIALLRETTDLQRELRAAELDRAAALRELAGDAEGAALANERYRLTVEAISRESLGALLEKTRTPAEQYAAAVEEIVAVTEAAGASSADLDRLLEQLGKDFQEAAENSKEFREAQEFWDLVRGPAAEYERAIAEVVRRGEELGASQDDITRAVRQTARAVAGVSGDLSDLDSEERAVAAAADAYAEAIARVTEALDAQAISQSEANRQMDEARKKFEEAKEAAADAAEEEEEFNKSVDRTKEVLAGELQDLITDVLTGAKDIGDAFVEAFAHAVAAILELIFQMTVLKALQDSLEQGSAGGGGGGAAGFGTTFLRSFIGGLFGGGGVGSGITGANNISTGVGFGSGVAGFAASGAIARATPGGVPVITAEGGDDEAIIPLHDPAAINLLRSALGTGNSSGGRVASMPVNIRITNNGAPLAVDAVRTRSGQDGLEIEAVVRNVIQDDLARGGQTTRSLGRRFRVLPPRSQV